MNMPRPDFQNTEIAFKHKSDSELNLAWMVFRAINVKPLVTVGPLMVTSALKLKLPITGLLRWTVFRLFCGGETLESCRQTVDRLKSEAVFSILDYGVEGEKSELGYDTTLREVLKCIATTKGQESTPFCVFKVTALGRFELLETITTKGVSQLPPNLAAEWQTVVSRVNIICETAINAGKLVMIDAEETWIQGAIDTLALTMMQKYNTRQPNIYTTIQMYRTDGLQMIESLIETARTEKWLPGIKLVRGAYLEKERLRAATMGYKSPIQVNKESTDKAYDLALKRIMSSPAHGHLCAGTHNTQSTQAVIDLMSQHSLKPTSPRVWFAQLLGMSDDLTFNLAHAGYLAAKYVPYGPIAAVLPYLFRRARENSSIAGQSSRELELIKNELTRRAARRPHP
jgi:proline dehydrogenase